MQFLRSFFQPKGHRFRGFIGVIQIFPGKRGMKFWMLNITALIPEHDEYLKPAEAAKAFSVIPQIKLINVDEAKHLWVGEPMVHRVLSEVVKIVAPEKLPLALEF